MSVNRGLRIDGPARRAFLLVLAVVFVGAPAASAQTGFDLGARGNVMLGSGEPTNDVIGWGVFGHWRFSDRWSVGASVDHSSEFDVERTPELVGIEQDPSLETIDSTATSTGVLVWIERRYARPQGRLEWFWGVGAGINSVDVDEVTGRAADGRTFTLTTDAGTEPMLAALAGGRLRLVSQLFLELSVRAEQHFADWTIEDRDSGARGTIDDYLLTGGSLGLAFRF